MVAKEKFKGSQSADIDFVAFGELIIDTVARFYGIPPEILRAPINGTYSANRAMISRVRELEGRVYGG